MRRLTISLFAILALTLAPGMPSRALDCAGWVPMLSPYHLDSLLLDVTVIRFVDNAERPDWPDMEVHVNGRLQGEWPADTALVSGNRFTPISAEFPVGSRSIIGLQRNDEDELLILPECRESLPVVDGQVEGRVRDYACPDHAHANDQGLQCTFPQESMTLAAFTTVQADYYGGLRQGLAYCASNELEACPTQVAKFFLSDSSLHLSGVEIYERPGAPVVRDERLGVMDASLRLLGAGEKGGLLFEVLSLTPRNPAPATP